MAILNKLLKQHDELQDEIDTLVAKAVAKNSKEHVSQLKLVVANTVVEAKALCLGKAETKQVVELLGQLKAELV